MRHFRLAFLSFFLLLGSLVNAYSGDDYNFQQDRMLLAHDCVVVISSFEDKDHITAYSHRGAKLWNSSFHAKILSWKMTNDCIFVFSKDRNGYSTYLTCIDRIDGKLIWQRP